MERAGGKGEGKFRRIHRLHRSAVQEGVAGGEVQRVAAPWSSSSSRREFAFGLKVSQSWPPAGTNRTSTCEEQRKIIPGTSPAKPGDEDGA
jgi:hypothetical protein